MSCLGLRAQQLWPEHEAQGADKAITNAIDTHVRAEQTRRADDEDGPAEVLVPAG